VQTREVVGRDDVSGFLRRPPGHRTLEGGLGLRVAGQVVEERLAVDTIEGDAAVPDGFEQPGCRRVVEVAPHDGHAT
jgi:hypothetical protein